MDYAGIFDGANDGMGDLGAAAQRGSDTKCFLPSAAATNRNTIGAILPNAG